MDFDEAIESHAEWKIRLRTAVSSSERESLDPEQVGRDDQCELGRWMRGPGLAVAHQPGVGTLAAQHRQFHHFAAEIVRLARAGDVLEAEALLCGEFLRCSSAVISAIVELKKMSDRENR